MVVIALRKILFQALAVKFGLPFPIAGAGTLRFCKRRAWAASCHAILKPSYYNICCCLTKSKTNTTQLKVYIIIYDHHLQFNLRAIVFLPDYRWIEIGAAILQQQECDAENVNVEQPHRVSRWIGTVRRDRASVWGSCQDKRFESSCLLRCMT